MQTAAVVDTESNRDYIRGLEGTGRPVLMIPRAEWTPGDHLTEEISKASCVFFLDCVSAGICIGGMRDPDALLDTTVGALGSATERVLGDHGLHADINPIGRSARDIVKAVDDFLEGGSVLLIGGPAFLVSEVGASFSDGPRIDMELAGTFSSWVFNGSPAKARALLRGGAADVLILRGPEDAVLCEVALQCPLSEIAGTVEIRSGSVWAAADLDERGIAHAPVHP